MMKYVPNTLQLNERILLEPQLHWAVYFNICFYLFLIYTCLCDFVNNVLIRNIGYNEFTRYLLFFIATTISLRIIYLFIKNFSTEMAVTNFRVVYKKGIFNIQTQELTNNKIESISVQQSIMGRLLNYGDILFSGTGTSKLIFKKVFAPWWIKAQVEDIIQESYVSSVAHNAD